MDNLIAEGKAKPFIIVMDNGTWTMPGGQRPPRPPAGAPRGEWPPKGWAEGFQKTLLQDIIRWSTQLSHVCRSSASSDGRVVDGRHADPGDHPG